MAISIPIEDCGIAQMEFGGTTHTFDLFDVFDEISALARKHNKADDPAFSPEFKAGVKAILSKITGAPPTLFTTAVATQFQARVYDAAIELQKKTQPESTPTPASSASMASTPPASVPFVAGY